MIKDKKSGHDLAQKTEVRRKFRRMARGAGKVKTDGGKQLALVLVWLVLLTVWLYHGLIGGLLMGGLLGRLYAIATSLAAVTLAVGLNMALCWAWGGPWQARRTEENLARIGYTNENGEVPELLSIARDPDNPRIKVYEFAVCGLPVSVWLDFAEKIQSALNVTILDVQYGQDNQHIKLKVAPPVSALPSKILWIPHCLPLAPYTLAAGVDCAGQVITWDLRKGHAILAGMTGSGKTVLLKSLLWQCLCCGAEVKIADYKGKVGFSRWEKKCQICSTAEELLPMLEDLAKEMAQREELLAKGHYQDIDEYQAKPKAHRLQHIVLAVDEVVELFDKTGADKEKKKQIEQIEYLMSSIARKGRTAGIHLLLSGQRPDSLALAPQIKANLSFACCGSANRVLSEIVLDSTAAADMIPRGAQGRFVVNQGADLYTVFQSYYFDEWRLNYD